MQLIYLARHATPEWSRLDIPYHLPPGPPLTSRGKEEAQALGVFAQANQVGRLFASPLERCDHTARLAASAAGIPVETVVELTEWQPGEKEDSIHHRVCPAFEKIALLSEQIGTVMLVTHGGPISHLLVCLGMDRDTLNSFRTYDHRNPLPPAGAWLARRANPAAPWELSLAFIPQCESTPV